MEWGKAGFPRTRHVEGKRFRVLWGCSSAALCLCLGGTCGKHKGFAVVMISLPQSSLQHEAVSVLQGCMPCWHAGMHAPESASTCTEQANND
eukprot:1161587-Pelagomonas_calceolata.AAC.1